MIEGINSNYGVINYPMSKRRVLPKKHDMSNPITPSMMQGLESLGIYNMALVKQKDNFNHPKLEMLAPANMMTDDAVKQGAQEVTDPNGNVEYYTKKDSEHDMIINYYPSEKYKDKIEKIEIQSCQTGNVIKEQTNWLDSFEPNSCHISYMPEKGICYNASYEDNRLCSTSKEITDDNGNMKNYYIYYDKNRKPSYDIHISNSKDNSSLGIGLDENQKVESIYNNIERGNISYSRSISLHNGAIINVQDNQSVNTNIPNYMEMDIMQDSELQPVAKVDRDEMAEQYRNNPNAQYNGNGTIKEYKDNNTKITFDENSQTITEYIDKDIQKITEYSEKDDDFFCNVTYKKGDITKIISLKNGKPQEYSEYINGELTKNMGYDENGYLTCAW